MRNTKTYLFRVALITLSIFQLSCDVMNQGSTLFRVMRALKFHVTEISVEQPARLKRLDVLFLWQLDKALDEGEIEEIHDFVEGGGTLIVAGDRSAFDSLLLDYGLEMRKASKRMEISQRIPVDPYFPDRPVNEISSRTDFAIQPIERDAAPLFGKEMDYSIVTFREGDGRAYFMSCPYIFTDFGLGENGNARFLYNLMSTLPRRAHIGLAESRYYAYGSTDTANPLIHLLFKTPVGLSVFYIGLIIFLFLILRGRRFGMPLVVEEAHRRFSSEYVLAMTALYQRGNTRSAILKQIRDTFRSDLAARWNINPSIESASFVEEIAKRKPIDGDELQELLTRLEPHGDISEAHLLSLAKQVEAYRDKEKIGRTRLAQR